MNRKDEIVKQIAQFILKNPGKWKNINIDEISKQVTFIELELIDKKLTIEVSPEGKIEFSFDDGWSYFVGNPLDAVFFKPHHALNYLKEIFDSKRLKNISISHLNKEYEGTIELASVDYHRNMGIEKIYEVSIEIGAERIVIGTVSEYPQGVFNFIDFNPQYSFSKENIIDYIKRGDDLTFSLSTNSNVAHFSLKEQLSYFTIKKILIPSLNGYTDPNEWFKKLQNLDLRLKISCKSMGGYSYENEVRVSTFVSPYHRNPVFDVAISVPPQDIAERYDLATITLVQKTNTPVQVKIVYQAMPGAEIIPREYHF